MAGMIYVHIPFCVKKCAYCDFLSKAASEEEKAAYVDALIREIACDELLGEKEISSVFFGGGTPSVLKPSQLEGIMDALHGRYSISREAEISLEANPGTVDIDSLRAFRQLGINRLSLGIQSFNDYELKTLGRIHTASQGIEAVEYAAKAGFDNLNLDLMAQLPGQSIESLRHNIEQALSLKPKHLSIYSLIVEEGTEFYNRYGSSKGSELLPTEEETLAMDEMLHELLRQAGFIHYETSNYALPGYECRHNSGYWRRIPYRGYGLGAASLIKDINGREYRFSAEQSMKEYIADCAKGLGDRKRALEPLYELDERERQQEFIMLGLRMFEGVSAGEFEEQFGRPLLEACDGIKKYIESGHIKSCGDRLCFTEEGMAVSNVILSDII